MNTHILITGAAGGIGAVTARMAAQRGSAVTLMARASGRGEADKLAAEIVEAGGKALVVIADVSNEDEVVTAFQSAVETLGPLSGVVNAAGITANAWVKDLDAGLADKVMKINVVGLMVCCREALRHMSTSSGGQGGSIVNVSSMAATIGGRPGASVYAASKAAVDTFTTGLAREAAAEGVRVNSIRPGMIATKMTANLDANPELLKALEASIPMGRRGQPEEIAELALWLLSPAASFVTGAHVNAGGGGFHVAGER